MLTSPLFELDFKDKTEYIFCHYFRIAPFAYRPNKMDKYEEVLTSDKFKTSEEYHKYIFENDISDTENRYIEDDKHFSNPIGTLLLEFLEADLSDTKFIKKNTLKFGSVAVSENNPGNNDFDFDIQFPQNGDSEYDRSIDMEYFDNSLDQISKKKLDDYRKTQKEFKKIINFSYNLDNLFYLNGLTPTQRYFIYKRSCAKDDYFSITNLYLSNINLGYGINYGDFSIDIKYFGKTPQELAKELKKNDKKNHHYQGRAYVYSFNSLISAYYFSLLYFIENNIPIKKCKNCGKYFIPENRNSSVYCNRIYTDKKTCKEIGANNAYNEKLKKDEVNGLYRKILSAKKMTANRNPDIPLYLEKYEKWKAEANQFKKDIKSGKKTEDEFKQWLENTKKQY